MGGYAWVTLATNDSYSLGALVLAHSLRGVRTKHDLAVLVTPGVTATMREKLSTVFTLVQEVNVLDSKDEANLALLARPELGITFTKLHCWRLTQYEKCVFVDADALVIRNCDELFDRDEFSAAPDVGWPDCFNSGVFVFRPSDETFASLTSFAAAKGSFDGGDQGLLNQYFSDWARNDIAKHLPFIYNMCSTATYSYLPAFKQYGDDVRIIHFIGSTKPWLQYFDTITSQVHPAPGTNHLQPLLQLWWNIFCDKVHPQLSPVMAGIAGALAKITIGEARSPEQIAFEEHMRKQSWEQGQIDYMGRDSFENIWKKITETLGKQLERQPSPPKVAPKSDEMETEKSLPRPIEVGLEAETVSAALSGLECKVEKEDPLIDELAHGDDVRKLILPLSELMQVETGEPTTIVAATTMAPLEESKMAVDKIEEVLVGRKDVPEVDNLEIPTESQVPIQVAESVLEADVKESVTEDLKPVTEEAISSIALAAQESVPAVLETAMEAVDSMVPRSNGRADMTSEIGNGIDALEIASSAGLASATVAVVEGISLPVEPRLAVTEEEPKSPQTPQELPTENAQSVPLVPTATSLNQTQKDTENPVAAPPAVDPPPKAERSDSTPCCVNAKQSVPTTEPVTQGELLSCPLKATKKMEDLPVKMEEDVTPRDSQITVSPAGTEVPETTLGKEAPEVSADTVVSGKSVDKKLSKESVDKKISEDLVGKEESKESIGKVNPEVAVGKKDLAVLIGKENLKESASKVVSKDSVEKEVAEKSGVKEVAKKSVGKEVAKKSVDKVVVKKPVDKDAPKKPVDKKVPKQSTDKEGPKNPVNKEVCATSIDKEVPEKPVDREGSGESSEASLSIEDSSPLRPARTKELQIPDTPTVTEATPPTSPPIGGAAASLDDPQATNRTTKKTVKKVVKKTSETKSTPEATADPETEVKKVTKKIVKKSTKKKEEDTNVPTEAKKVIKTVKKTTTKTQQQTLDVTEAAAPETPPPSAPEVPVPPKRKLKTTTKTTSQKTDSEP